MDNKWLFSLLMTCTLSSLMLTLVAQTDPGLQLSECQDLAIARYPLQKQKPLLREATQLKIEQLDAQRMPTIDWNARATYQSETVSLPFTLPGQEDAFTVPKLNGQSSLNASYLLYDGGLSVASKDLQQLVLEKDLQTLEVALFPIKEQVQQLYFGILLARAQDEVLANTLADLRQRQANLTAAAKHGVVLSINISKLEVEMVKLAKRRLDIQGHEESLLALLGDWIGQPLSVETPLTTPTLTEVTFTEASRRPELSLFQQQKALVLEESKLLEIKRKPKVSAFVQAGVGYANPLNFFDTNLSPFAIGGVNFHWNIWDGKQSQKQKDWLSVQSQLIETQAETFQFQQDLLDQQYQKKADAINALMIQDRQLIALQGEILQQVNAQLTQGVITSTEYISELNTQVNAQLELALHELQLKELKVQYLIKKGIW